MERVPVAEPAVPTIDLLAYLVARTEQHAVPWKAAGSDTFEYVGEKATVTIRSQDGDGRFPYILDLLGPEGGIIDTVESGWDRDDFGDTTSLPWNDDLRRLHEGARRAAFDIDTLALSLMSELGEVASEEDEAEASPAEDDDI